ncbi:hypothetical protein CBR_g22277 [Chara braunii]|uniref:Uncharacterized protein n=1 Tax=Chara braunii TaxID=69332 RepID=A0A388L2K5_CHABU|nr:hypothetical protein CBR_g22277 [Chara braunii]|eukprot:GBG76529.1 hypothetical protein CBR_g22277 [Chara braunii]
MVCPSVWSVIARLWKTAMVQEVGLGKACAVFRSTMSIPSDLKKDGMRHVRRPVSDMTAAADKTILRTLGWSGMLEALLWMPPQY